MASLTLPLSCARIWAPCDGSTLTTEVNTMMLIPLPMPRRVISSPIHMISAVPAVTVATISSTRGTEKLGTRSS